MTVWVTEYPGAGYVSAPQEPALAVQQGATAAAALSTFALGATTGLVRITADTAYYLLVTASASTVAASTTNAPRMPPNIIEYRTVAPSARITALST